MSGALPCIEDSHTAPPAGSPREASLWKGQGVPWAWGVGGWTALIIFHVLDNNTQQITVKGSPCVQSWLVQMHNLI